MKKFFFLLVITFGILFLTNVVWLVLNLYSWATVGIDIILSGSEAGLFENRRKTNFMAYYENLLCLQN